MEINFTDSGNILTILVVGIGLFFQSWRQNLARQKQDTTIRDRFIANADKQSSDIEELRSKIEENEARYQEDRRAESKRHQLELEARDNVIRNLEKTIIEHLQRNEEDRKERAIADAKERDYYRETINAVRDDSRELMQIASAAQTQFEASEKQKSELASANLILNATIAGQREQLTQLQTRLDLLQEERTKLQKDLEALQAARQENERLRADILALQQQIADKDAEIARLKQEIQELKRSNINPAMVLTAPESAIKPEAQQ